MYSINKLSKSSYLKVVALIFWCCFNNYCYSQVVPPYIDSLADKIEKYGIKQHQPVMFVHFDKTIYSNNENVWFTAYLMNSIKYEEDKHSILLLSLVNDDTRKVVLEDKFTMQKGLSFGNVFIPDSIAAGNYTFVAYTNVMEQGRPQVMFKQPITIKTISQPTFTAALSPIDTAIASAEKKIRLTTDLSAAGVLANAPVNYYVGSPANHVLSGTAKTDAVGQYIFNIPANILSEGNNKLYVTVNYKKENKEISMALPVVKQAAIVNFYPEGGNLVNNLQVFVGCETRTANNAPLKATAILYSNDIATDTIETDGYGLGKFLLKPQAGNRYYVKLYNTDTRYELPVILPSGPVVFAPHALANDTLAVTLFDNMPEKLFLAIHNYNEVFSLTPVLMNNNIKRVKVLLADVPKGLTQLTIIDSLGRPFAQRTFFAHYNRKASLQINTGLPEYGTRKKVNVKIKLKTPADTAAMALVSIACVQENRIDIKKKNDIESYFYLKNDLGELPLKENYLTDADADKQFLENILLIKGWSRYKWTDALKVTNADTVHQLQTPAFTGRVTTFTGKPLKKPLSVVLMTDGTIKPLETDSTGNLILDNEDLVTAPDKKIMLMVSGEKPEYYKISVADPYSITTANMPARITYKDYTTIARQSTATMQLEGMQNSIQLKEVKIVDKNDDQFFGVKGSNACGDYVCRYNILNCPNHRTANDNKPPIVGSKYQWAGGYIIYSGCTMLQKDEYSNIFKGIYSAVDFYPADYSEINPSQPEYISTIYWKHLAQLKQSGQIELSFYTSDITGRFKIVVQGITNNDVVYGEKTFNVVK